MKFDENKSWQLSAIVHSPLIGVGGGSNHTSPTLIANALVDSTTLEPLIDSTTLDPLEES